MNNYINSQIMGIVSEVVHSQRDRDILRDKYVNGYTHEKIAEIHDMSTSQIKRIIHRYKRSLFDDDPKMAPK